MTTSRPSESNKSSHQETRGFGRAFLFEVVSLDSAPTGV
jgi:hypothetical protein